MFLETSKIRWFVMKWCQGKGIDLGCQRDPITPDCIAMDLRVLPEVNHVGDIRGPLPWPDAEFDFVYSSHALEDIVDTQAALTEWSRILKPGGNLILYVPHPELFKGYNAEHVYPGFTPEQLIAYLKPMGYEILASEIHDVRTEQHPCHSSLVVARKQPSNS